MNSLVLIVMILVALFVVIFVGSIITFFRRTTKDGGIETLVSGVNPNNESMKTSHDVIDIDKLIDSIDSDEFKEYVRIANDHSLEKTYIRLCIDELSQYPSGYIFKFKESEPLPDYSEKGLVKTPSFRDLCAKIKDWLKLDDCVYRDPKVCQLPFMATGLEGCCDSFVEICDGSQEPYISFWLKRYIPKDA